MGSSNQQEITFTNVGANDRLPYAKADIVKVSRVSDNFSLSFYQLDYQAMAINAAAPEGVKISPNDMLISVGKIVLSTQGFSQLYTELTLMNQASEIEVKVTT